MGETSTKRNLLAENTQSSSRKRGLHGGMGLATSDFGVSPPERQGLRGAFRCALWLLF